MPKHILVVEDDKELKEAVVTVLQRAGYKVSMCNTYHNVLPCLDNNNIDLVILDGYLDHYDGRKLLQQIKEHPDFKSTPIIFASVMSNKELEGYQPDAVLPKAYGMHELLAEVNKQLNK